jgi:hypothetical protein
VHSSSALYLHHSICQHMFVYMWGGRCGCHWQPKQLHDTAAACLWSLQLGIREYKQFLSFMCPGYQKTGVFPPWGTDPAMCPRPIFGMYDDHDSGW